MVTIVQPNNLVIDSEQQTIDYLIGIAVQPRTPYERGQRINIIDRSALPAGVAAFNVGMIVEAPNSSPTAWIFVLNDNGEKAVVAIPKAHIAPR